MADLELRVRRPQYTRVAVIGLLSAGLGALPMLWEHRRWARSFDEAGGSQCAGAGVVSGMETCPALSGRK
ncbi:MAG: hypothetical protein M5U26_15045 [Planctomycetota bacterium]|nr:hypothetical protein [Planctomycetota bacterium]